MAHQPTESQPHELNLFERAIDFSIKVLDRLDPIETSFFQHTEPRADIFITTHKRTGEVDVRIVRLDGLIYEHNVITLTSFRFDNSTRIYKADRLHEVKRGLEPTGSISRDEAVKLLKDYEFW